MLFSSPIFLFYFLPLCLTAYFVLPWRNAVLLFASLLFYAWGEPRFVPVLLASAALNFSVGWAIAKHPARQGLWLAVGILANLAILTHYKYLGFLVSSWNMLRAEPFPLPEIVLPLGISFFTFQGISYLVDIARGEIPAQTNPLRFLLYKAMFPQLIAGPIVRYAEVSGQLVHRGLDAERLWSGARQAVLGLAQKVLIANPVAQVADALFKAPPADLSASAAWIGLLCYAVQILYDFAGYSNMAIGLGRILGFDYPENFNRPYAAHSVTDFWRRWHMSLSRWFRDYLYIPLGGNRCGSARTALHLGLVFFLCGLWHGASWNFIIWGIWHGGALALERSAWGLVLARLPAAFGQAYTLALVFLGWVWFRATDASAALAYYGALLGAGAAEGSGYAWQMHMGREQWITLGVGLLWACSPVRLAGGPNWAQLLLMGVAFVMCAAALAAGTFNPFIYFHF